MELRHVELVFYVNEVLGVANRTHISRPSALVMYAMGADGASGLRRIVDIIKEETSTTLGLVGLNDINEVSSDIIEQKLFMNTTY